MEKTLTLNKDAKPEQEAPVEVLETVQMDLAPGAGMALNYGGRQFIHGASYKVPANVAWGLKELMARGWSHEASLKDRSDYSKNRVNRSGRSV